jgi:hypothetical protein
MMEIVIGGIVASMIGISCFYPRFGYVAAATIGSLVGGYVVFTAGVMIVSVGVGWLFLQCLELFLNGK